MQTIYPIRLVFEYQNSADPYSLPLTEHCIWDRSASPRNEASSTALVRGILLHKTCGTLLHISVGTVTVDEVRSNFGLTLIKAASQGGGQLIKQSSYLLSCISSYLLLRIGIYFVSSMVNDLARSWGDLWN